MAAIIAGLNRQCPKCYRRSGRVPEMVPLLGQIRAAITGPVSKARPRRFAARISCAVKRVPECSWPVGHRPSDGSLTRVVTLPKSHNNCRQILDALVRGGYGRSRIHRFRCRSVGYRRFRHHDTSPTDGGVRCLALRLPTGLAALLAVSFAVSSAIANPLITAITQNGTGVSAVLPIATSASSQLPQPAGAGTQGALVDEAYAYTTRTHEWTAAVTDTTTFLLSTTTGNTNGAPVATQSVRPFPSYLNGLEYAQLDNASRSITDFSVNMTFAQAVKAYLFIDNRTGLASGTKANTTDPDLTGPLAWVTTDGWDARQHWDYAKWAS